MSHLQQGSNENPSQSVGKGKKGDFYFSRVQRLDPRVYLSHRSMDGKNYTKIHLISFHFMISYWKLRGSFMSCCKSETLSVNLSASQIHRRTNAWKYLIIGYCSFRGYLSTYNNIEVDPAAKMRISPQIYLSRESMDRQMNENLHLIIFHLIIHIHEHTNSRKYRFNKLSFDTSAVHTRSPESLWSIFSPL